jgi:arsenate reductase
MSQDHLIVFVCEHGAAKSLLAATYFNHMARERNVEFQAIARGTTPDPELSAITVAGLTTDGLSPSASIPQKLTLEEVESAQQVIAFCELPDPFQKKGGIEQWDDIPSVSENYERARDIVVEHLLHLIDNL